MGRTVFEREAGGHRFLVIVTASHGVGVAAIVRCDTCSHVVERVAFPWRDSVSRVNDAIDRAIEYHAYPRIEWRAA